MKIDELFDVKDKVALVTGGSRGIGEMIAATFLSNGVKVYISARKADPCDQKAIELSKEVFGVKFIHFFSAFVFADVSSTSPGCIGINSFFASTPRYCSIVSMKSIKFIGEELPILNIL